MFSLIFGLLAATKNSYDYMCDVDLSPHIVSTRRTINPGTVYCFNPAFDIIIDGDPVEFKIYHNDQLEKTGKGIYCIGSSSSNTLKMFTTETQQTVNIYYFPFTYENNMMFLTNKESISNVNIAQNDDPTLLSAFLQVGKFSNCELTVDLGSGAYLSGVFFEEDFSGTKQISFGSSSTESYYYNYNYLWLLGSSVYSKNEEIKISIDSTRNGDPWKHEICGAVKYESNAIYNYDEFVMLDSSESLSTPAIIGISVGAVIALIIIIVIIYFCACRKSSKIGNENENPQQQPPQQQQQQRPPPPQGQYYPPPPQQGQNYPPPPQGQYYQPPPQQGQNYPPPPSSQYYPPPPPPPGQYYPPPQGQYYPPPPQQGQNNQPPPPGQYYPPPQGQYYPPQPQQRQNNPPQPPNTNNEPQPPQDQNYTPHPPSSDSSSSDS